jgi:uncharacterized RDD family membrane protein YckC
LWDEDEHRWREPVVPASWWRRAAAVLLDAAIVGIPAAILIASVASALRDDDPGGPAGSDALVLLGTVFAIVFIVIPIYYALFIGGTGATPGKRLLGLQVTDASSAESIGYGRALLRWITFSAMWIVFFPVGVLDALSPLWDRNRQAWHDKVANSVVVRATRKIDAAPSDTQQRGAPWQ